MKEIKLSQNKVAIVDDDMFEYLSQWNWFARKKDHTYYAFRMQRINGKKIAIHMHRVILNLTDRHILCDHIDHNGLNNQKSNLRIASYSQNSTNRTSQKNSSSKYLGVSWNRQLKKWHAQTRKGKTRIHIGYFESDIDAAKAYNEQAIKLHGEYANLNFIVTKKLPTFENE